MRLVRPALALALVGSLAGAGLAGAAVKPTPVCNLVTDAAGDTLAVQADTIDIVSADVATDAKQLTVAIRVKKLGTSESSAPTGYTHRFAFTVAGSDTVYYLMASTVPAPLGTQTFEYGTTVSPNLTKLGDAIGVVDTAKNEIRMTAPLDAFGIKPGTKLENLQAITQRRFVVALYGGDSTTVDATKTYTAGAKSCVTPGK